MWHHLGIQSGQMDFGWLIQIFPEQISILDITSYLMLINHDIL